MSVVWTETATSQLEAIRDYFSRNNPAFARASAGRIVVLGESLEGRPFFGPEVPEYGDPDIREVYEHPYRILYRVNDVDVQVVSVIHSARQLPLLPPI